MLALIAAATCCAAEKAAVDFNRDVRPIFSDNCFACHGPDDKRRMANLRLDTEDGVVKVVTPADLAKSRLWIRISAADRAMRMPPPQAGTTLNDAQVAVIRKWIEQGARW